jgi:solute carrier family 25 phosphate transporter 23/24/25/41
MFKRYDEDNDGGISLEELQRNIDKMGLPTIMANEIMSKADILKDNFICYSEFEKYSENQIMKYYKVFYNLDSDEDGKLDYKQAKQTFHEIYPNMDLTDDVYKKLFYTMDQDKSGLISFEEWCQFLFLFPQQNIDYMVNEWRLYALITLSTQEIITPTVEQDLHCKKGKHSKYLEILKTFICGGIAGGVSRTVTAPLDQVRTLFQTMYINSKPPNILKGILDIYHERGIQGLYRGNSLSIVMSILEQAMRFVIIEYSKKLCENEHGHINPHYFLAIGVVTGIISTLFLFPLEVVRVRVISSDENKHKIQNKFKKIYSNYGIKGFYCGFIPHMISVLPAGSFNVMFYNLLRKIFISESDAENARVHKFIFVGGAAALITGTVTYPLTLLTTRLIVANREVIEKRQRIGLFRMARSTFSQEGIFGFFKGYKASMIRLILGQSCNFGTYETLKLRFKIHSKKDKK